MQLRARRTTVLAWSLCAVAVCLLGVSTWLRSQAGGPPVAPEEPWVVAALWTLGSLGAPFVGAVVAARLPANPYGWLWCIFGLALVVAGHGRLLAEAAGAPAWAARLLDDYGFLTCVCSVVLVFLWFPTGRAPGPRWRWTASVAVGLTAALGLMLPFVPLEDDALADSAWAVQGALGRALSTMFTAGVVGLFGLCLAAIVSVLLRFRHAGVVERQQLKWFAVAAGFNATVIVLDLVNLDEVLIRALGDWSWALLSAGGFGLLPVALGIAVLRYRLYEVDRIISRTVSYTVLTAALVTLYLVAVSALRAVLEPVTGTSDTAVAASTLLVAAAFHPARRRVQRAVDHRFNRSRYDAARTVEAFASQLRSGQATDDVAAGLRTTVLHAVGPRAVGVWLRPPAAPGADVPARAAGSRG